MKNYYQEGFKIGYYSDAFNNISNRYTNPYKSDTDKHKNWDRGYCDGLKSENIEEVDIKMYICESCGKEHEDAENFRLIAGNVLIPDQGGLIGGNIFSGKKEKPEKQRKIRIARSDDKSLRVYGMLYCVDCFIRASGFTEDGKNKYKVIRNLLFSSKTGTLCAIDSNDSNRLHVLNGGYSMIRDGDKVTVEKTGCSNFIDDFKAYSRKEFNKEYPYFGY